MSYSSVFCDIWCAYLLSVTNSIPDMPSQPRKLALKFFQHFILLGKPMSWEQTSQSIQRVCALIAAITNGILLHLIVNKSSPKLGSYKYLMIYISLFEIFYAIVDVLFAPVSALEFPFYSLLCQQLFTSGSIYVLLPSLSQSIFPSYLIPLLYRKFQHQPFSELFCD